MSSMDASPHDVCCVWIGLLLVWRPFVRQAPPRLPLNPERRRVGSSDGLVPPAVAVTETALRMLSISASIMTLTHENWQVPFSAERLPALDVALVCCI
jgi:hypothetical protein